MNVGTTIRLLRTAASVSQKDMATDLGISASYLSLLENGKREPSLSQLKGISKSLRIPLSALLYGVIDEPTDGTVNQDSIDIRQKFQDTLIGLTRDRVKLEN